MVKFVTILFFVLMTTAYPLRAGPQDSILANRQTGPGEITKAGGNPAAYAERIRSSAQGLESMQYRGFTILVNNLSDGTYEVQAFLLVPYGNHRVNSIFSSLYKSSVEFSYRYDPGTKKIIRRHFLFPPNSLTGWANPKDYAIMEKLDWNEPFPSRGCYTETPIHSLEESGREYLEVGCLSDRETAIRFVQRFIDYMRGARGM